MSTELLRQMSENLRTQDNAATRDPIFYVQTLRREYGWDPQYTDNYVWLDVDNDNGEAADEDVALLEDGKHNWPSHFIKTGYHDEWHNVQPFFTRAGAEQYIDENRHNLNQPRIYVDSAYRNREWQAVRELLMARLPEFMAALRDIVSALDDHTAESIEFDSAIEDARKLL